MREVANAIPGCSHRAYSSSPSPEWSPAARESYHNEELSHQRDDCELAPAFATGCQHCAPAPRRSPLHGSGSVQGKGNLKNRNKIKTVELTVVRILREQTQTRCVDPSKLSSHGTYISQIPNLFYSLTPGHLASCKVHY